MSGRRFKHPGPLGMRLPPLSRFHLTAPLPRPALLDSADAVDVLLLEAAYRGATKYDLLRLLTRSRERSPLDSGLLSTSEFILTGDFGYVLDRVNNALRAYQLLVSNEFIRLPSTVKRAFYSPKKQPISDGIDSYGRTRPIYYKAGYNNPVDILSQINDFVFLGHSTQLHQAFINVFGNIGNDLDKQSPGLARRISGEIKKIGGFNPRPIAGTNRISNHAFGLAIDVDADLNPHIKHPKAFEIVLEVSGYDIRKYQDDLLECVIDHSRLDQLRIKIKQASDKFQMWLRRYLALSEERRKAPQSYDADTESNLKLLDTLVKAIKMDEAKGWAAHGFFSIPPEFFTVMVLLGDQSGKFRWGGEYKKTKDYMHFELLHEKVIKPDSPPRPLEEILYF